MKRTILFMTIAIFSFIACSKDDDKYSPENVSTIQDNDSTNIYAQSLEENNLVVDSPSEINDISSIVDTVGYKLVFGKRSDNAWFAKFNLSGGSSLFEYTAPDFYKEQIENKTSFIYQYEIPNEHRILFEIAIGSKSNNVPGVSVCDSLCNMLLDFDSGNVLFSEVKEALSNNVSTQQIKYYFENYFLMLEGENADWKSLRCFDYEGEILWQRETTLYEANSGMTKSKFYHMFKASNDSIFICGKDLFLQKIDLKNKNTLWFVDLDKTPSTYYPGKSSFYTMTKRECVSDTILIYYDQTKEIIDQFATEEYKLIAKWLCKVNLDNGIKISDEVLESFE